jgi:hypothetical protein
MTSPAQDWPELDEAALHGLAGDVVRSIAPHTEADPAALLVDFLVSFGIMVGSKPHKTADGAPHPARLFAVIAGKTSRARKGTSHERIKQLLMSADKDFVKDRTFSGLSTGEGLIAAIPDDGDKRALVIEPEFASVLKRAGRDGNTLSTVIREAWDHGNLRVMTRNNPLQTNLAHIGVIAHITIEELREKLSATEMASGFANRFLFICAKRSKNLPHAPDLPAEDLSRLTRLTRSALDEAKQIHLLRWKNGRALDTWSRFYRECAETEIRGLAGALTARAEAITFRLAILYALLERSSAISYRHVRAAEAVWKYSEASAIYIFGRETGDRVTDRLLEELRRVHPEGLTATEQLNLFGRHVTSERVASARASLETDCLAVTRSEDTGGRPRLTTYALVDDEAS